MSYNDSNIDTSTSEMGQDYDYLKSMYTKYTASDSKTLISEQKKKENKIEQFLLNFFDWRVVFGVLLTITLLSSIGLNKLYEHLKYINIYTPYGLDMISYFYYGVIINMFIMVFTISFYFNIRTNTGMRGPIGAMGKKGQQGESDYCDICNVKPVPLKRVHNYEKTQLVDIPSKLSKLKEIEHGWRLITKKVRSPTGSYKNTKSVETNPNELIYLVGVIANIESSTKNIKQVQFIFRDKDNNTIQFPENRIPENSNELDTVKSEQVPINSGIYNIEYNVYGSNIVGMKLNYIDYIKTNSTPKSKYIGNIKETPIETTKKDWIYKKSDKNYIYFLSDLTCKYNDDGICNIEFNKIMINLDYKV